MKKKVKPDLLIQHQDKTKKRELFSVIHDFIEIIFYSSLSTVGHRDLFSARRRTSNIFIKKPISYFWYHPFWQIVQFQLHHVFDFLG